MTETHVLFVEDDDVIREATQLTLERDGFAVTAVPDGIAGLEAFRARRPDIALLDVMVPGMDGVSLCRRIRDESAVPVIMLSARADSIDVVLGLEAGADDYVTKPFDAAVLVARIRAVLRRFGHAGTGSGAGGPGDTAVPLRFGDLVIDTDGMEVRGRGAPVALTPTEMRLLLEFSAAPGTVLSRDRLLASVWDYEWGGDTRVVDVHVQRLRGKIGQDRIETVRGFGYKLKALTGGALPRPRSGPGLRWKLTAAIALVSALMALAMAVVVRDAARVDMMNNSRNLQDDRVQVAARNYEATRRLMFGARVDDPRLPGGLRTAAAQGQRATDIEYVNGEPIVWASSRCRRTRSVDQQPVRRTGRGPRQPRRPPGRRLRRRRPGGSALSVLVGGQLSRRLRKAAVAARRVAEGEPDVRVRDAIGRRVRDETDELARAVDAMADALQDRLEAERRVTADIAHELRTPVTGLVTAAGLLPPGRPSELVQDRGQAMRTLVEDVLEVSRLDGAAERAELQEIPLREFVGHADARPGAGRGAGGAASRWVHTDPRRLERVLGNLLANAARHGRAPVEVEIEGRCCGCATTVPVSPRRCCGRARAGSAPVPATGRARGTGSG